MEWATGVLAAFHRKYPGISYDVQVHGADQVVRKVHDNAVDIGLSVNPSIVTGIKVHSAVEFRLGIITPDQHSLTARDTVRLSDCIEYPFIIPDTSLALRGVIDRLLATSAVAVNVVTVSNSLQMVKQLVSQNVGIGLATSIDVANETKTGKLHSRTVMSIRPYSHCVWPKIGNCRKLPRRWSIVSAMR